MGLIGDEATVGAELRARDDSVVMMAVSFVVLRVEALQE
jgi:hypothetical protein